MWCVVIDSQNCQARLAIICMLHTFVGVSNGVSTKNG
jgi:hypothetical protein